MYGFSVIDLLIADATGQGFTPECFGCPMGGSELEIVLVAEELARTGFKVAVVSRCEVEFKRAGVKYAHLGQAPEARSLWVQRTTRVAWQDFKGPIAMRITDLGWDAYDWDLLADPRCALACVSNWQRSTFDRQKPIARTEIINPPMLPIKRRTNLPRGPQRWLFTSHMGKGWAATCEIWKHLKRDHVIPESFTLAGLFPWGDLPPWSENSDGIERPRSVTPAEMRAAYEAPDTGALFHVNTFAETWGAAQAWAVRAGLPVHILCKSGLNGLAESVQGPGLTDDWGAFVRGIKDHVAGHPMVYEGKLRDLSVKTSAKRWARLLELI